MATVLVPVEVKQCENCPRTFVRPIVLLPDRESGQMHRCGPKYCMTCRRLSKLEPVRRTEYAESAWSRYYRKRPDAWEQARKMLRIQ